MEYVAGYFIGVIITVALIGFLTKGNDLDEEDYRMILGITAFWPLFLAIGIVIGIPFTVLQLCRGEFNHIIKDDIQYLKEKWDNIGKE